MHSHLTFFVQLDDSNLTALLTAYNTSIASVHEDTSVSTAGVQYNAPWSLDRIDQPSLPLDGAYHFDNLGTNVYVYIVDTVSLINEARYTEHSLEGVSDS